MQWYKRPETRFEDGVFGSVGAKQARKLLDLGAADAYISKDLEGSLGITCLGTQDTVNMPDGGTQVVYTHASLKLHLQSFKVQLVFKVIDFGIPFDALLGYAFLKEYKVVMNYGSKSASLWKLQKNFIIGSKQLGQQDRENVQELPIFPTKAGKADVAEVNIITAVQAKRALHECELSFIAFVSHLAEEQQPEFVCAMGSGSFGKISNNHMDLNLLQELQA